jgi:hypothetical protein
VSTAGILGFWKVGFVVEVKKPLSQVSKSAVSVGAVTPSAKIQHCTAILASAGLAAVTL